VARYLLGRVGQALLVLFLISLATFFLIRLVPGDPARVILGLHATPAALSELRHQLGLDRPVVSQYWHFIRNAATLNFGESALQHESVSSLIAPRLTPSLLLIGYGSVVALLVAVPTAVLAALRRNRLTDHILRLMSMVSLVAPSFLLGIVLALVFGLEVHLFPVSGYGTGIGGHIRSLTLPAITLGIGIATPLMRTLRSSMVEAFGADFVEAGRARGLSEWRVLIHHVLRNSLSSTITVLAVFIGGLLSATAVIESVFAIPGIGSLLVNAVTTRDFPVVQALALVFGSCVVFVSLMADLLYVVIDPRVRL
jgi:peptide/nickel transport system permease protein